MCTFDTPIEPGHTYALAKPLTLRTPPDSMTGSRAEIVTSWVTPTEWSDRFEAISDLPAGRTGTGAPLELVDTLAAAGSPQADVDPENDSATITLTVTGRHEPDFAAIGARRTAAVGDQLSVEVGALNNGPGTLHPDLFSNNQVGTRVRLPGNVTLLDTGSDCYVVGESDTELECEPTKDLAPGEQATFTLALKVERARGEDGQVEVGYVPATDIGIRATGRGNNLAKIVIEVPGADLPITGPGPLTPAGIGLALVTVGLLLAVRRRSRPVCAHAGGETVAGRQREESAT